MAISKGINDLTNPEASVPKTLQVATGKLKKDVEGDLLHTKGGCRAGGEGVFGCGQKLHPRDGHSWMPSTGT